MNEKKMRENKKGKKKEENTRKNRIGKYLK